MGILSQGFASVSTKQLSVLLTGQCSKQLGTKEVSPEKQHSWAKGGKSCII